MGVRLCLIFSYIATCSRKVYLSNRNGGNGSRVIDDHEGRSSNSGRVKNDVLEGIRLGPDVIAIGMSGEEVHGTGGEVDTGLGCAVIDRDTHEVPMDDLSHRKGKHPEKECSDVKQPFLDEGQDSGTTRHKFHLAGGENFVGLTDGTVVEDTGTDSSVGKRAGTANSTATGGTLVSAVRLTVEGEDVLHLGSAGAHTIESALNGVGTLIDKVEFDLAGVDPKVDRRALEEAGRSDNGTVGSRRLGEDGGGHQG